jgi:hypothetical protein
MVSIAVVLLGCSVSSHGAPTDGGSRVDADGVDTGTDASPPLDASDDASDARVLIDASDDAASLVDAAVDADAGPDPMESDINVCLDNVDCIVVPYSHCCGSTKRAIHARFLDAYNAHPEWQVFNDPGPCAVIGACRSDSEVTEARCNNGFCSLVYP